MSLGPRVPSFRLSGFNFEVFRLYAFVLRLARWVAFGLGHLFFVLVIVEVFVRGQLEEKIAEVDWQTRILIQYSARCTQSTHGLTEQKDNSRLTRSSYQ